MNGIKAQWLSTFFLLHQRVRIVFSSAKTVVFLTILLFISKPASAQTPLQTVPTEDPTSFGACISNPNYIESTFQIQPGKYSVSIDNNDTNISAAFLTNPDRLCKPIATSADIQELEIDASQDLVTIQFFSDYELTQDNRPSIVFSKHGADDSTTCQSATGCPYEYNDVLTTLYPKRVSSYFDSMDAYLYDQVSSLPVSSVKYAIDNKIVYEKNTLEPFNQNYIPPGDRATQIKIEFNNGQYALIDEEVKLATTGDLYRLARSWVYQNKVVFIYPIILLIAVTAVSSLQYARIKRHEKHLWRAEHLANSEESLDALHEGRMTQTDPDESLGTVLGALKTPLIVISCLLLGITMLTSFGATLVRTDGESMLQTLQNNQQMLVNKAGRTLASVKGADYVPSRGDVIIFERAHEGLDAEKSLLVKRVIGLPGDTVTVTDDKITVTYNEEGKEKTFVDVEQPWFGTVTKSDFNGRISATLGVGELFVVGDNRDGSIDSRFFGPIKAQDIYGSVLRGI